MKNSLIFQVSPEFNCVDFFAKGIRSASIWRSRSNRPQPCIIYFEGMTGEDIKISSEIVDIGNREELSVLKFSPIDEHIAGAVSEPIDKSFRGKNEVKKLVFEDDENRAESGIEITSSTDKKIVILAGDMPYSLALKGMLDAPFEFVTELDFSAYKREEFELR